jgi:hypothetical protein
MVCEDARHERDRIDRGDRRFEDADQIGPQRLG